LKKKKFVFNPLNSTLSIMQLESLPVALFPVFQSYPLHGDYRRFVSVSQSPLWQDVKRETDYYNLTKYFSLEFFLKDSFRNKAMKKCHKVLVSECSGFTNPSHLSGVPCVTLEDLGITTLDGLQDSHLDSEKL
jgi:hypothetical protein